HLGLVCATSSNVWKHMRNSQSTQRFPTLEDARARDPCQEAQQNYLRSAVSRLRLPPSLKAQEPCRKFFSGGNRLEESQAQTLPLLLSLRRLTRTSSGC